MINYSFEVIEVNKPAKCMLIKYTADGYSEHLVGTRIPFAGESVQSVVREYAPLPLWIQEKAEFADIDVGISGTIELPQPAPFTENTETELLISEEEQIAASEEYQREVIREVVLEILNEQ
jgi:hypothetical protein